MLAASRRQARNRSASSSLPVHHEGRIFYPEGIASSSPGLARRAYPGTMRPNDPNHNVAPSGEGIQVGNFCYTAPGWNRVAVPSARVESSRGSRVAMVFQAVIAAG